MWTEQSSVGAKQEAALKEQWGGQLVLGTDIPVDSFSILDQVGIRALPSVLVLSPGAETAYRADRSTFGRYMIIENDFFVSLSETGTDALAILRPAGEGKIEVQSGKVGEWLTVDLSQGQKLGLAIITDKEVNNNSARFWAKAFVFDQQDK